MAQVQALGCQWINLDSGLFNDTLLASAHENGCKVGLWTVNTLAARQRFADGGRY